MQQLCEYQDAVRVSQGAVNAVLWALPVPHQLELFSSCGRCCNRQLW